MIPAYHSAMSNPVEIAARLADDGVYLKDKADSGLGGRVRARPTPPAGSFQAAVGTHA